LAHATAAVALGLQFLALVWRPLGVAFPQSLTVIRERTANDPLGTPALEVVTVMPSVSWVISLFVFFACASHLSAAVLIIRKTRMCVEYIFERHTSPIRWIESAITSPLIVMLLLALCGAQDTFLQLMAGSSMVVGMALGWMIEWVGPRYVTDGTPANWGQKCLFGLMAFAIAMPWLALWCYACLARELPIFIYLAAFGAFVAFVVFITTTVAERLFGYITYWVSEVLYCAFSLFTKTYVAWVVWNGLKA